jgi:hypothetical protein
MRPKEVGYRIREKLRKETDRARLWFSIDGADIDRDFAALLERQESSRSWLMKAPSRRFYSSVNPSNRQKLVGLILRHRPEWIDRAAAEGDRLVEHEMNLLGHGGIKVDHEIDWQRDPVTGYAWPRRYWADYDLVSFRDRDAKVIHELNRQQHLPRLAKAFLLTGNECYAREAVVQMESWIDQNPRWTGVNWNSSLEVALRTISWMWTIFPLLSSKSLDELALRRICSALFTQLDHVHRYPSFYSSPNTHLIGEAAAVFMGGLLFPELKKASAWRQLGAAVLMNEMQNQVGPEGVYRELSSYYHCYATDFYLQAMLLGRWNRFVFPEWMWIKLSRMFEFVGHLTRSDGTIPLLGDDDGGRVLALASDNYRSFQDGLGSAAILFGRPDFKHQSGGFSQESLWLLGEESFSIYESIDNQPSSTTHRFFPDAGYFIQRSGWSHEDSHLVFDCGNLGAPNGAHGHADALSISFHTRGKDLLLDPGTSVYNGAPEWRNYFRSTRAHNTVVVDGQDQSQPAGTFSWKRKAASQVLNHFVLPGFEHADGQHDGYYRLPHPVMHRRRVSFIQSRYWIVLDELRGRGEHDFDFFYHFAADAELFAFGDEVKGEVECRARAGEAELQMALYASAAVQTEATCGQTGPIQGWSSHRYGQRKPTPVLRVGMRSSPPAAMMAFLTPGNLASSRRIRVTGGPAIAAALCIEEFEDLAVFSIQDAYLHVHDYRMRGEFFWVRTCNGALTTLLAVNASLFSKTGDIVFESDEPISHVLVHFWEDGMVIERGGYEGKVYVRDLRDRQFQRN